MSRIPLFRVNQWLDSWSPVEKQELGEVPHHFYLASISLLKLRQLAGVHKRDTAVRELRSKGAGYQRALDQSRSKQISRFIESGFPLSSDTSLNPNKYPSLVHPGWLPTSILVNVLTKEDTRYRGNKELRVRENRLLNIVNKNGQEYLEIPDDSFELNSNDDILSSELQPIEIIDGQHRVFSVDKFDEFPLDYEVPVVLFNGLSESWQAYLFWVINVEPKRINTSLAFDLYPELRSQAWLERGENIKIYQEHRAQELTEIMWRNENSIWKNRIELLGTRVPGHVSNASFIRSLTSSFVRKWTDPDKLGGLFGSIDEKKRILPWKRAQQAAFLMFCWNILSGQIKVTNIAWINAFTQEKSNKQSLPEALVNGRSLLSTDQGVRTIHYIFNVFCLKNYENLHLDEWYMPNISLDPEDDNISEALNELNKNAELAQYLTDISKTLITNLDWRTSNAPGLSDEERQKQAAYRGSAGYSLLRKKALEALTKSDNSTIVTIAKALNDK